MITVFIFLFGLAIGSFLNALIYRLHVGKSVFAGRSFCPHCSHRLSARDLVPLFSFIFLRGQCRYCQKPISWQYPLVELATALALLLLYWHYGLGLTFFFEALMACFLVVIFVYDALHFLILDRVIIPAIVIVFLYQLIWHLSLFTNFLIAGILGGGFFLIQFLISRGRWIGAGDIRLGFFAGLLVGLGPLAVALFTAYMLGALSGLYLIFSRKKSWQSKIAFGPFLVIGIFTALLIGQTLIQWYWHQV